VAVHPAAAIDDRVAVEGTLSDRWRGEFHVVHSTPPASRVGGEGAIGYRR
jgi:hypothetical protein